MSILPCGVDVFDEFEEIVVLAIVPVVVLETRMVDIFEADVDVFGEIVLLAITPVVVLETRLAGIPEAAIVASPDLGVSESIIPL